MLTEMYQKRWDGRHGVDCALQVTSLWQAGFGGCFQSVLDLDCQSSEWHINHCGSTPPPSVRFSQKYY